MTDMQCRLCLCVALMVERPVNVQYNVNTQTVTFRSPTSTKLCLHVRLLLADTTVTSQTHCTVDESTGTSSVKLSGDVGNINAVEVSFCVSGRPDVCGPAQNATISQ